MQTDSHNAGPRVAILLYGPARSFEKTAASFLRYAAGPNDASVFYFGPTATDQPTALHKGGMDEAGNFTNLKSSVSSMRSVDQAAFVRSYGDCLKAYSFHDVTEGKFLDDAAAAIPRNKWLFGIHPYRMLSMFYNMEGAIDLLLQYERNSDQEFDEVVITRTDLVFYAPLRLGIGSAEIHMPKGEGFDERTGMPHAGNAPVFYYRNKLTGDYIPGGLSLQFNDQIIAIKRQDLENLRGLYAKVMECLHQGVPANPETILYLLLVGKGQLSMQFRGDWLHEICRSDEPNHVSLLDLPELAKVDPMHPSLRTQGSAAGRRGLTQRKRTAVLLYGLLREYKTTAGSLLRHVVEPSKASVFYFGPEQSDKPTRAHNGTFDERGFFLHNPKGAFEKLAPVNASDLKDVYGAALKATKLHDVQQETFLKLASKVCDRDEWLFMLSPHRMLSMFYNIVGAVKLLQEYEQQNGQMFDEVILTRPDLAFYAPVAPDIKPGELHIADSEGFDQNGNEHRGSAPVFFYKNASDGSYVPAGRRHTFNDQVLAFRREDLVHFENIYENLVKAFEARVPGSPETVFYLMLVQNAGMKLVVHTDWLHEIFRAGDPVIKNVTDTPDIANIDPRHRKAERFLSEEERRRIYPENDAARLPAPSTASAEGQELGESQGQDSVARNSSAALLERLFEPAQEAELGAVRIGLARSLLWRARRQSRRGNFAASEKLYSRLLQLAPHRHRSWVQYGHILKEHGNLPAALAAYRMALKIVPDDADAILHYQTLLRDPRLREGVGRA